MQYGIDITTVAEKDMGLGLVLVGWWMVEVAERHASCPLESGRIHPFRVHTHVWVPQQSH